MIQLSIYIIIHLTSTYKERNTDSNTFCYLLIRVSHRDLLPFSLKIWIFKYSPSNPLEVNIKQILYCSTQLGILTLMVIKSRSILKRRLKYNSIEINKHLRWEFLTTTSLFWLNIKLEDWSTFFMTIILLWVIFVHV